MTVDDFEYVSDRELVHDINTKPEHSTLSVEEKYYLYLKLRHEKGSIGTVDNLWTDSYGKLGSRPVEAKEITLIKKVISVSCPHIAIWDNCFTVRVYDDKRNLIILPSALPEDSPFITEEKSQFKFVHKTFLVEKEWPGDRFIHEINNIFNCEPDYKFQTRRKMKSIRFFNEIKDEYELGYIVNLCILYEDMI